ncbi:hypothetical protein DFQ15_11676 [Xylophilus ampelinus]|uniref:Uncharacterized protein n=1 Tax=Xylophilus ampelinus TaxID=54067 RepID=A0A318SFD3_9BURK|nr:hypothetical protein DFQ15_11676 [Xylophilus ampelinus]
MPRRDRRERLNIYPKGPEAHVFCRLDATQIIAIDPLVHATYTPSEGGRLTAPMPGKVVSFAVRAGDAVARGQRGR